MGFILIQDPDLVERSSWESVTAMVIWLWVNAHKN